MGIVTVDMNNDQIIPEAGGEEEEEKTATTAMTKTTVNSEQKGAKANNRLLLHYTHEKRFDSYKRDIHQIWSETFGNTPVIEVKVIVGNRNNRDARSELVRKRSH